MTWEIAEHIRDNTLPCGSDHCGCKDRAFRGSDLTAGQCWCKKLFLTCTFNFGHFVVWKYRVDTPFEAEETSNGVCKLACPAEDAEVTEWFRALGIDVYYTEIVAKVFRESYDTPAENYVTFLFCDQSLASAFRLRFGGMPPRI